MTTNNYNTGDTVVAASVDTAVLKTLFDANTVLAATTDNTPAALTVGASTFVGRKASGNIAAMTVGDSKRLIDVYRLTGAIAETFPAKQARHSNTATLVTQRQHFAAVYLEAGETATTVTWYSGATPAGTPTNQWASLYTLAGAKLRVSDDKTNEAWGSHAAKTFTLSTPYLVLTSGLYLIGLMVKATTVPTMYVLDNAASSAIMAAAPVTNAHDATNNALTDPASAPDPAVLTANPTLPYGYVS